jgi:thymidylate kinase
VLIALEGVDGSGKSSLAAEIARQIREKYPNDYGVEELHSGPLTEPPLDAYVYSIDRYVPGGGYHIVADRWHYGEQVYGPIYREKSAIKLSEWRWMEHWLDSRGMRVFVVTNSLEEIARRLEERGEDFLQPEHVERVINEFNSFENAATFGGYVVVGGDKSLEELAADIISSALRAENAAAWIERSTTSYVGPANPAAVLVGDKRGGIPPFMSTGAFMPVRNNSADFLWSALDDDLWPRVGVVNVKEEFDVPELLERLGNPPVVALGQEAHKGLKDFGEIDHGRLPHPQWVRRFKNKHQKEYGQAIRRVIDTQEDLSKWPK